MGGHPYWYFVPYRDDLQGALDELRARELAAGRYNPVIRILRGFGTEAFFAQAPTSSSYDGGKPVEICFAGYSFD